MSHMDNLNTLIEFGIDENHKQDAMMYAVVCSIAGSLAAIADAAERHMNKPQPLFGDAFVKAYMAGDDD